MKTLGLVSIFWIATMGCASAKIQQHDKISKTLVCEPSGCSGEICTEKGKKIITTCLMMPQYKCLKNTKCEVQKNGKCEWTPNEEYLSCIKAF